MPQKKGYSLEKDIEYLGKRHKKSAKEQQRHEAGKKPKKKEDWVARLKRNVKMLLKGKKYHESQMKKKNNPHNKTGY